MNIVAADWLPYALPFKRPWQTSRGVLHSRHGRLLRLRTADGRTGWGDCAPLPEFGIDAAATTTFAEECAYLDLAAQAAGLPLNAWLSGEAPVRTLAVNTVLGPIFSLTPESFTDNFSVFKLKVGSADSTAEIAHLQRLCRNLPGHVRLRLDANAAWNYNTAREFLAACRDLPVEGLEEPLRAPDSAGLRQLQSALPFPLAIDESIHLLDAAFFAEPPVRRLVIKPARQGGLLASLEMALRARAAGVEVVVTSALESACGLLACTHLAAAIAPAGIHGLATADWLAEDCGQPVCVNQACLSLPEIPGLGFAGYQAG